MAVLGDTALQDLTKALRAGSQAQGTLTGLEADYKTAQDLGNKEFKANKFGDVGWGAILGKIGAEHRSGQDMKRLRPQVEAARQGVAENANAQGLYNAKLAQDKVLEDRRKTDQTYNRGVKTSDRTFKLSQAKEASRLSALKDKLALAATGGDRITMWDEDNNKKDFRQDANTGRFTHLDGTAIDSAKNWSVTAPVKVTSSQAFKDEYGGLSQYQVQNGLNHLRKEIKPLQSVVQAVNNLNSKLLDLPDANKDIPGIGMLEGGTGLMSRAVRGVFSGPEGRNIHDAWTQTIAPLIRKQAGLAQTKTELERVEQAYGADWTSDEEIFRIAYPQIMQALQNDLQTIQGTFTPPIMKAYKNTMKESGFPTIFEEAQFTNPFAPKDDAELQNTADMTDAQLQAEYDK